MTITSENAIALGPSQENALDRISEWLRNAPPVRYCDSAECLGYPDADGDMPHTHGGAQDFPVMSVGGYAGTGKTALAGQLADRLGARVTFGTPTNKAAWVLRHKLPESQRGRCGTYHSLLFRPNSWHSCLATGEIAGELGCVCGNGFDDDACACPRFRCADARCQANAEGCRVESHLTFDRREYAGGHRDLLVLDEASMITE